MGISAMNFVAMVTDTASNITKLGKLVEENLSQSIITVPTIIYSSPHRRPTEYPDIWNLSEKILHVPTTPALTERVFSAASNIINKKVRLSPETANLLIFFKENQAFTEWCE